MRQIDVTLDLANQILLVAQGAGNLIMSVYREVCSGQAGAEGALLKYKTDESPLTRADLLAHQHISQELAVLTPGIARVSEEDEQSHKRRKPTGDFWLIDPLDGTKEFLAKNGEFTVNIALVRDGKSVLGVVVAPALGQAYWGAEGLGAYRSMSGRVERIYVTTASATAQPIRVVASKSHMNIETVNFIQRLGAYTLVQAGSSLKFCRIAEGTAEVYPRMGPTCEWDTAAAQAIVEAAGGYVCRMDGSPLRYGKPDVLNPQFVASSEPLHHA